MVQIMGQQNGKRKKSKKNRKNGKGKKRDRTK